MLRKDRCNALVPHVPRPSIVILALAVFQIGDREERRPSTIRVITTSSRTAAAAARLPWRGRVGIKARRRTEVWDESRLKRERARPRPGNVIAIALLALLLAAVAVTVTVAASAAATTPKRWLLPRRDAARGVEPKA